MTNKQETTENQIFCSFYLSDSEFALPVKSVQEVVNVPESLTPVPLAPSYLLGLFNLRGLIVPVLDLSEILHLSKISHAENSMAPKEPKIAIVESNEVIVGLLFDSTGDVFKEQNGERSSFEDGSVVSGAFRRGERGQIVQILEVGRLFKLQHVPKDITNHRDGRRSRQSYRGSRHQCISFRVGRSLCALPMGAIQEIIKLEKVQNSSLGGGFCLGVIDLRGTTVPVIDFSDLLCNSKNSTQAPTQNQHNFSNRKLIVMKLDTELFGLLVDSVDNIISYYKDELLPFPVLEQARGRMFLGCLTVTGNSEVLLLDPQEILDRKEVLEITRGHSELYQAHDKSREDSKGATGSKSKNRKGYLIFKMERSCALPMSEVAEIIRYPEEIIRLPQRKEFVEGVVNLRGKLVTLLDGCAMYKDSSQESDSINNIDKKRDHQKVLVFHKEGNYFGLIVDEVQSIVHFAEEDKMKIPLLSMSTEPDSIANDISEVVRVTLEKGEKQDLLIMDLNRVVQRIS